jgi:hypothetical protein
MNWETVTRKIVNGIIGEIGLIAKMDINLERRPVAVKILLLLLLLLIMMNPLILLMKKDRYPIVTVHVKLIVLITALEVEKLGVWHLVFRIVTKCVVIVVELTEIIIMMNVNLVKKRLKHDLVVSGVNGQILVNVPNLVMVVRKLVPENVSAETMIIIMIMKILADQYPIVTVHVKPIVKITALEVEKLDV